MPPHVSQEGVCGFTPLHLNISLKHLLVLMSVKVGGVLQPSTRDGWACACAWVNGWQYIIMCYTGLVPHYPECTLCSRS